MRDMENAKRLKREWYQRNTALTKQRARARDARLIEWFKEYKSSLACVRCGENHPACLDFHHVSGEKTSEISKMVAYGRGKQVILDEIAKCEVLCSNCHRKEHYKP